MDSKQKNSKQKNSKQKHTKKKNDLLTKNTNVTNISKDISTYNVLRNNFNNVKVNTHYNFNFDQIFSHQTVKSMINLSVPHVYNPQLFRKIYNLNSIPYDGTGTKIAIIVAYHHPEILFNLDFYCLTTGIRKPSNVHIVNLFAGISTPSWEVETNLDLQMVSTVSPGAHIYVVEAKSDLIIDLVGAVSYAVNILKVNIVSMSWGMPENILNPLLEPFFINNNVIFIAASGDSNYVSYPSSSPNVASIGGVNLIANEDGIIITETAWSSGGSGPSKIFNKPISQSTVSDNKRLTPDISGLADPQHGFLTYNGIYGFVSVGGTSVAAPSYAGIFSLCDQCRFLNNKSALTTNNVINNNIMNLLYKKIYTNNIKYTNDIFDVKIGFDGIYRAKTGYDLATGLGNIKDISSFINESLNA